MVASLLALLDEHEPLSEEQIAAHLGQPTDAVRHVLSALDVLRLVEASAVGEIEGHSVRPAACWWLTEAGRRELGRIRSRSA